jgi:hypothetical protein
VIIQASARGAKARRNNKKEDSTSAKFAESDSILQTPLTKAHKKEQKRLAKQKKAEVARRAKDLKKKKKADLLLKKRNDKEQRRAMVTGNTKVGKSKTKKQKGVGFTSGLADKEVSVVDERNQPIAIERKETAARKRPLLSEAARAPTLVVAENPESDNRASPKSSYRRENISATVATFWNTMQKEAGDRATAEEAEERKERMKSEAEATLMKHEEQYTRKVEVEVRFEQKQRLKAEAKATVEAEAKVTNKVEEGADKDTEVGAQSEPLLLTAANATENTAVSAQDSKPLSFRFRRRVDAFHAFVEKHRCEIHFEDFRSQLKWLGDQSSFAIVVFFSLHYHV